MAYVITEKCECCGDCVDVCPVEAIREGEPVYVVDAELCVDCGACSDACPVDAPVPEDEA